MEFFLSFPPLKHVDALYQGYIVVCLESLGVRELWPCGHLEPASYHKIGEVLGVRQ